MAVLDLNDSKQVELYRQFVENSPYGQVTQDTKWAELKANWGHLFIYREDDQGNIIAAMTILTVEAVPGKLLAYCPKGPVADIHDVALVKSMVEEAVAELPDNVFLVRMDPEVIYDEKLDSIYKEAGFKTRNTEITYMHGNIQPRKNVELYYDGRGEDASVLTNEDELMLHFKPKHRNAIRRAIRDGVTITVGQSEEELKDFFELYKSMAGVHHITYRPFSYFENMGKIWADSDRFKVFVAKNDEGTPIAAGIGFNYGDKIWYMYAGSNKEYRHLQAPYLVQWEMLKWGLAEKKVRYDFGGVGEFSSEDGLYKFKHGFAYHDPDQEYIGELDWVLDQEAYDKYLEGFAE
ncbi:lipid II:glycine glycyltransferase FemX [Fructobacillus durionis]|uniref:Lipid II:glycine glycyltransferase (Peptidoglycan interpeptide bridge formation enzyme) n=1 Tax=Fructobacillus durionis TaxID=283737 RepID=A0A1I1GCQ3_9LACO|nr:peptidoglycan bridge formation glycyltransferase FemA/FemB family protein [Fructobacillus durionis]SFC09324.1 Lipid II:glycine glycyltransferase (Peptidoglycan interpeptide bridge formation enzyme) [Fructobacillus durionis]